jgi:hypothetical protein
MKRRLYGSQSDLSVTLLTRVNNVTLRCAQHRRNEMIILINAVPPGVWYRVKILLSGDTISAKLVIVPHSWADACKQ